MRRRRHHNNTGLRQIRRGKTRRQVRRIAARLGIKVKQSSSPTEGDCPLKRALFSLALLFVLLLTTAACASQEVRDHNTLIQYLQEPNPSPELTARVDKIMEQRGAPITYDGPLPPPRDPARDCWQEASRQWRCNEP